MAGPGTENLCYTPNETGHDTKTFDQVETLLQRLTDAVPKLKQEEKDLEAKAASIEKEINSAFSSAPADKPLHEQTSTQDQTQLEIENYISCTSQEVEYIKKQKEAMMIEKNKFISARHTKLEELDSLKRFMRQKSEDMKLMEQAARKEISICEEIKRQSSESVSKIKELLNEVTYLSVHIRKNNVLYHMENKRKQEQEEKSRILLETKEEIQFLQNMIEGTWKELKLLIGEVKDFEIDMCQQVREWRMTLDKLSNEKKDAIDLFFESSDKLIEQMMKWKDGSKELEEVIIEVANDKENVKA